MSPSRSTPRTSPQKAKEFGLFGASARFPTDMIVTPSGDVVDRNVGAVPAAQYVDRLGRVAAMGAGAVAWPRWPGSRSRQSEYARAPGGPARAELTPAAVDDGRRRTSPSRHAPSVGWPTALPPTSDRPTRRSRRAAPARPALLRSSGTRTAFPQGYASLPWRQGSSASGNPPPGGNPSPSPDGSDARIARRPLPSGRPSRPRSAWTAIAPSSWSRTIAGSTGPTSRA